MKRVGRNEPCPCGSGKKFKKCHMGKEDELMTGKAEISMVMSEKITSLPSVAYGKSKEMADALDIKKLTGSSMGIKFIDLKKYTQLELSGQDHSQKKQAGIGGVVVNALKTMKSDPENIYIAISEDIGESALVHQIAHVLDYLGGSRLMTAAAKPLGFDLGIPVEHLEHPHEFGYWLDYLKSEFNIQLDAEDTIIDFLYDNRVLIRGEEIEKQDRTVLKSKSDRMLSFLNEKAGELNDMIQELPGYIGSRAKKD